MTFKNYKNFRKFEFSNKASLKENKKDESKPNYSTKADYEKVIKDIEVSNNDIEPEKVLKNFITKTND